MSDTTQVAYRKGCLAFFHGLTISDNPYPEFLLNGCDLNYLHLYWIAGFNLGKLRNTYAKQRR